MRKVNKHSDRQQKKMTILGHELDAALYAKYLLALEQRKGNPPGRQEELAVDDATHKLKPSSRSKEIFHSLALDEVFGCHVAAHRIGEWPWFSRGLMREAADDLLLKTANKLAELSSVLLEYRAAVKEEDSQYVQDWLKLDQRLAAARLNNQKSKPLKAA